jgi:F0F1-type ATP synthase assembly protein I
MLYYIIKLVISAVLIVAVSEVSKRYSVIGGVLASLPLVSFLGMIWLYVDTRDPERVAALSTSIFWLVLPSLVLFIALPPLLKHMPFAAALSIATLLMFAAYGATVWLLRYCGVGT